MFAFTVAVQRINEILTGGKNGNGTGGGLVRTPGPGPPHPPGPPPGPGLLPVPGIPMPPVHQPPPMLAAPIQPPELQQVSVNIIGVKEQASTSQF